MAPEGGEPARSCAPATHNRLPRLCVRTRGPERTLSRGINVARERAAKRAFAVCTYTRPGHRVTRVLAYVHTRACCPMYVYVAYVCTNAGRERNGSSPASSCFSPHAGVSLLSLRLSRARHRCACPVALVPAPVRTCVRVRGARVRVGEREKRQGQEKERGKEKRERGQSVCAYTRGDNAIPRHTQVPASDQPRLVPPRHLASLTYDTIRGEPQGRQVAHKTKETREKRWLEEER